MRIRTDYHGTTWITVRVVNPRPWRGRPAREFGATRSVWHWQVLEEDYEPLGIEA